VAGTWIVFLAFCSLLLAGSIICPKCGFENGDERAACVHCAAELPKRAAGSGESVQSAGAVSALAGKLRFLEAVVVEQELAEAQPYLEKKLDVARLFLINAQALEMLADPSQASTRPEQIERLIKRCEQGTGRVRIKCPVCQGSGQRQFTTSSLRGEQTTREALGQPCTECAGSGYVTRNASFEDVRYRKARAADEYRLAQQARKYVPVGDAWVPQDLETKLTVRQQAKIRRITASPCASCAGLGRLDCPECRSTGRAKCPNRGCVNGKIKVDLKDSRLIKLKEKAEQVCSVCAGTGFVNCGECGGRGSVLCSKCGGSGQRPPCIRCAGQGCATCDECKGAGQGKKGICDRCGGEGALICTTCRGDGRRR
jgi:hypothetical protein